MKSPRKMKAKSNGAYKFRLSQKKDFTGILSLKETLNYQMHGGQFVVVCHLSHSLLSYAFVSLACLIDTNSFCACYVTFGISVVKSTAICNE